MDRDVPTHSLQTNHEEQLSTFLMSGSRQDTRMISWGRYLRCQHTVCALGRPGPCRTIPPPGPEERLKCYPDLKDAGDLDLTSSFASIRRSSTSEKLKLANVMNWLTTDTNLSPAC